MYSYSFGYLPFYINVSDANSSIIREVNTYLVISVGNYFIKV